MYFTWAHARMEKGLGTCIAAVRVVASFWFSARSLTLHFIERANWGLGCNDITCK